ncbi:MAG TPA: DUF4810 domain-containing protein [Candidatus Limnocylindria bacterium]|nr:DUF4810 domain-containing protein [Candidatus Limnocylindria bacterium]
MSRGPAAAALLLAALVAVGCGPGPLYHWGHYETLVYEMYAHPGKAGPAEQIDKLTEDIATAEAKGRAVPPGVHAHLGYMYLQEGNTLAARREFEIEKQLFPEATIFMDRLLAPPAEP